MLQRGDMCKCGEGPLGFPPGEIARVMHRAREDGLLASLGDLCVSATEDMKAFGSITDDSLAPLMEALRRVPGTASDDAKAKVQVFLDAFFGRLIGQAELTFAKDQEQVLSVVVALEVLVPSATVNGHSQDLRFMATSSDQVAQALKATSTAAAAMQTSAPIDDDSLASLCVGAQRITALQEPTAWGKLNSALLKAAATQVHKIRDEVKDYIMQRRLAELKTATDTLMTIAGGDADGQTWHSGFSGTSAKEILDWGKGSLLKVDGNSIKKGVAAVEQASTHLKSNMALLGIDIDHDIIAMPIASADYILRRARCSMLEGRLIDGLIKNARNPIALKKTAESNIKKITQQKFDDLVQPTLYEIAKLAALNRMVID